MQQAPEERRAKALADAIVSAQRDVTAERGGTIRVLGTVRDSVDALTAENHAHGEGSTVLQRRSIRVQWWLFGATTAAFLAAAIYAGIAYKQKETMIAQLRTMDLQRESMSKQTDLMRQQLEGTMSADFGSPGLYVIKDETTGLFFIRLSDANIGHLRTPDIHGAMDITIARFPDLKPIGQTRHIDITSQSVAGGAGWGHDTQVRELSESDQKYASQRRTVRVSGSLTFDDGYGRKTNYPFCSQYVGKWSIKTESGTTGGGGFVGCADFPDALRYIKTHTLIP